MWSACAAFVVLQQYVQDEAAKGMDCACHVPDVPGACHVLQKSYVFQHQW